MMPLWIDFPKMTKDMKESRTGRSQETNHSSNGKIYRKVNLAT